MNQPDNYFWCPECGTVESRSPARGYPPPCSRNECRVAKPRPHWQRFDRDAWDECQTHRVHASMLRRAGVVPSERRLRLLRCLFARMILPKAERNPLFVRVVACGEAWAETGTPPADADDVREQFFDLCFPRSTPHVADNEFFEASECLNPHLEVDLGRQHQARWAALADSYRELYPNPFLPLAWNPDWFTSTVRDLAAHIYEGRDFGAMPILADALQDAGCADEQILTHCRADKPHARGCWVLDAILGKE